ncbi:23S rRNA methyltransferase [Peptoniphilus sp. ING2-D1G]|nr:23S rRNA methyltransferase [Peptoniphilus sp. ING2-D1G]
MNDEVIRSKNNRYFKYFKSLLNKKSRQRENLFFAEGSKVIRESLEYEKPEYLVISENYTDDEDILRENLRTFIFSENLFRNLCDTENPQGIIAYYKFLHKNSLREINKGIYLFFDDLQDPGNVGALIRSALAFEIDGIFASRDTVEIYNPKLIRTTMASIFKIPIYIIDDKSELKVLKDKNFEILITDLEEGEVLYNQKFSSNTVIVLGNEARGVSRELKDFSDKKVYIPMSKNIDSLNVNVAGSILLYELNRRKYDNS